MITISDIKYYRNKPHLFEEDKYNSIDEQLVFNDYRSVGDEFFISILLGANQLNSLAQYIQANEFERIELYWRDDGQIECDFILPYDYFED